MPQRIVIVDDTITLGRILKTAILTTDDSLLVQVVPSAEEAILELGSYQVDLVITDLRLPGISGMDLVQWMRMRSPETKVILMTGIASYPLEQMALDMGAQAAFRKPFDTALFLKAVQKILQMHARPIQPPIPAGEGTEEKTAVPPEAQTLPEIFKRICSQVNVQSVVLLDENARIAAQSGVLLPDWFENDWAIPLIGSVHAGNRFSMMVGDGNACSAWFFSGKERTILAAMVGDYVFAAFWQDANTEVQGSAATFEAFIRARQDLIAGLQQLGVRLAATPPGEMQIEETPLAEVTETLEETADLSGINPEELSILLGKPGAELALETVEEFWETVIENAPDINLNQLDVLSFDQAQQLGLAPGDHELD